jgi:hypothetical protein
LPVFCATAAPSSQNHAQERQGADAAITERLCQLTGSTVDGVRLGVDGVRGLTGQTVNYKLDIGGLTGSDCKLQVRH